MVGLSCVLGRRGVELRKINRSGLRNVGFERFKKDRNVIHGVSIVVERDRRRIEGSSVAFNGDSVSNIRRQSLRTSYQELPSHVSKEGIYNASVMAFHLES